MYNAVLVPDVLLAFIKLGTQRWFLGCTEESSVSKTVDSEILTCGIGNKAVAKIFTGQNYSVTVRTLYHNDTFISLQSGSDFLTSQTANVPRTEVGVLASGVVTITGTPVDDKVWAQDALGKTYVATYATGDATVTGGVDGVMYTIIYDEEITNADKVVFDATKFPKNVELQLYGIAQDPATNLPIVNIFYNFPIASPDGSLDLAYAKGTNTSTSITFEILANNQTNEYGEYIVEPLA